MPTKSQKLSTKQRKISTPVLKLPKSAANYNHAYKNFGRDVELLFNQQSPNNFIEYLYSLPNSEDDVVRGAELFDTWCADERYYIRPQEIEVIQTNAAKIADILADTSVVVELGPGSIIPIRQKTYTLTRLMKKLKTYIAVDRCKDYLKAAKIWLNYKMPNLSVKTFNAEFEQMNQNLYPIENVSFFMFGNTLFNFPMQESQDKFKPLEDFLKNVRSLMHSGYFVIGYDCNENIDSLTAAYDNPLTAAFTLNLFQQIHRDLNVNFNPNLFEYYCDWNQDHYTLNMGAISMVDQVVKIGKTSFPLHKNQKLHLWNSYKIPTSVFSEIAERNGFTTKSVFTDSDKRVAIHILQAK